MKYELYYKKYGIRKLIDFIKPKIMENTDFTFPKFSILAWYTESKLPTCPSDDLGYLKNVEKGIVVNYKKYKQPIGKLKELNKNFKSYSRECKKKNVKFKFVDESMKIKLTPQTLFMANYSMLHLNYTYVPNPLIEYFKFYNAYHTLLSNVVESINKIDRMFYININLPVDRHSKKKLEHFKKRDIDKRLLSEFPTHNDLLLLELYKWLDKEYTNNSIFNVIPKDINILSKINFLFLFGKKLVMVNASKLIGMVKEFNIDSKITQVSSDKARIVFLAFIQNLQTLPPRNLEDLEKEEKVNTKLLIKKLEEGDDLNIELDADNKPVLDIKELKDKLEQDDELAEASDYDLDKDIEDNEHLDKLLDKLVIDEDENGDREIKEVRKYDSIEDLKKENRSLIENAELVIEERLATGEITEKEAKKLKEILKQQEAMLSPYEGDKTPLKELLTIKEEELKVDEKEYKVPEIKTTLDKEMLKATKINVMQKKYIKNIYKKDMTSVFFGLQNNGLLVSNYEVLEEDNILGKSETHVLEITPTKGRKFKVQIKLPKVEEDGTLKMSGNTYKLRYQKADFPIKKIDRFTVGLSSYYGKLFESKAKFKKYDLGFWLRKKIIEFAKADKSLSNLILIPVENMEVELPRIYSLISRYIKGFKLDGFNYNFDYNTRGELLKDVKDLDKIENKGKYILLAANEDKTEFILTDMKDKRYLYSKGKVKEIVPLLERLDIDIDNGPTEFALLKIFKQEFPVAVLLSYYLGIDKLLKLLKISYRLIDKNVRPNLEEGEFRIIFKDKQLIINRKDKLASIILASFNYIDKDIKQISYSNLNSKAQFTNLFNVMELQMNYITEIKLLETMFVDPITKNVLELAGEPTTFKGLLIRAAELLLTDYYKHPNSLDEMIIKGYERIPGMVYSVLVAAAKDYENKSMFGNAKMSVDPFSVWKMIGNDSTCMLEDDLNPITTVKQASEVTMMGAGGRSKETLVKKSREQHSSEIGILSESVKDSSDVGITGYFSAVPAINNLRGIKEEHDKLDSVTKIFSDSAVLHAGSMHDDSKRLNFIGIQNSHVIPIKNLKPPYVRTGYENIIPYKVSEKYAYMAEDDGIIRKVGKSEIIIEYKELGNKKVFLGKWSTKEESGLSYIHETITDLKEGMKIKKGDAIAWDKLFFSRDIFDKSKIIMKMTTDVNVALMEKPQTYEDSSAISKKLANEIQTDILKIKSYVLDKDTNIFEMVKVGDKVNPKDKLFIIDNSGMSNVDGISKDTLKTLQNIASKAPKAKVKGKISKIRIYYNCELEDMTKSLQELAKESDKELAKEHKNKHYTGRVTSEYSIKGKPLLEGQVEIKIYIETTLPMGVGDKGVLGNQLKSTVGEVYEYPVVTESGEEIDMIFSNKAIQARIVTSPIIIGTTAKVMKIIEDKALEIYFGNKPGNEELNLSLENKDNDIYVLKENDKKKINEILKLENDHVFVASKKLIKNKIKPIKGKLHAIPSFFASLGFCSDNWEMKEIRGEWDNKNLKLHDLEIKIKNKKWIEETSKPCYIYILRKENIKIEPYENKDGTRGTDFYFTEDKEIVETILVENPFKILKNNIEIKDK